MNLTFSPQAWADYVYWQGTDPKITERINELLKDVVRNPFTGLGKPEPLRHQWKGYWSRRIDAKHRLVYRASAEAIFIAQARFHYQPKRGSSRPGHGQKKDDAKLLCV